VLVLFSRPVYLLGRRPATLAGSSGKKKKVWPLPASKTTWSSKVILPHFGAMTARCTQHTAHPGSDDHQGTTGQSLGEARF